MLQDEVLGFKALLIALLAWKSTEAAWDYNTINMCNVVATGL